MIDQYPSPNGVLTSLIWRKTMSGGETSLSGYDNASQALSYTPGQEQVYLNGILLVRGDDYTATNGTSITGLSALAASDFVQVNCYNNFSVATTPATSITGTIANNQLANSAITINGSAVSLGGSVTLAGDIESVTAGTGLSGGGSSGGVTVSLDTTSQYVVPSQTGNSGKYLTTNGTSSSWGTVSQYSLPSQTGNSGKFLTTNGTAESWASAAANVNWVRLTSGTSWSVPSNIKYATIWAIAGGGGGAGGRNDGYEYNGGGGGAGGLATGTFDLSSVAGSTISYSIGAGGNGGAAFTNGSKGANTTFGTVAQAWYLSAEGGGYGSTGQTQGGSGGCGGGGGGGGGGPAGGGGGGGLGSRGEDAWPKSSGMLNRGGEATQGHVGGKAGDGVGIVAGAGGSGIIINGYKVGGGGGGANTSGYNYFTSINIWGGADVSVNAAGAAGTANTGGGGAGSRNSNGQTNAGGAGGSGVIFIQYWT